MYILFEEFVGSSTLTNICLSEIFVQPGSLASGLQLLRYVEVSGGHIYPVLIEYDG